MKRNIKMEGKPEKRLHKRIQCLNDCVIIDNSGVRKTDRINKQIQMTKGSELEWRKK